MAMSDARKQALFGANSVTHNNTDSASQHLATAKSNTSGQVNGYGQVWQGSGNSSTIGDWVTPANTGTTRSYSGGSGYSGGGSSYSGGGAYEAAPSGGVDSTAAIYAAYMQQMQAAQEAQRQAREAAYNKAAEQQKKNYDFSAGQVNQASDKALQEAYINKKIQERNMQQALTAQGLNGGASETTNASLYNNYGNARNNLETERNTQLGNILNTYQNNMANLEQQKASGTSADLSQYQTALSNLAASNGVNLVSMLQGNTGTGSTGGWRYNSQTGQWEQV